MSVNAKEKFADLKYEQLLADKYLIETCFSKKFKSIPAKQSLKDLDMKIKMENTYCEGAKFTDCRLPQTGCDYLGNSTSSTTTTTTIPITR